jgi:hypothetical protein
VSKKKKGFTLWPRPIWWYILSLLCITLICLLFPTSQRKVLHPFSDIFLSHSTFLLPNSELP